MIEILPLKVLRDEDAPIFGDTNVILAKLLRLGLPVASGFVITPPNLKLKTTLEHLNFSTYEVFEQSLYIVKKDLLKIPVPEELEEVKGEKFLVDGVVVKKRDLWKRLIEVWVEQLRSIIWREGFTLGVTERLGAILVVPVKDLRAFGECSFREDAESDIRADFGKLDPTNLQKLDQMVFLANKKLIIPYNFSWILDKEVRLSGVSPYTGELKEVINVDFSHSLESRGPVTKQPHPAAPLFSGTLGSQDGAPRLVPPLPHDLAASKVVLDLSVGEVPEGVYGGYLVGEKVYDLNKPSDSFDNLVIRMLTVSQNTDFVLLKLPDKSEGLPAGRQDMGKVRGALRLIHQESLFKPFIEALKFVRDSKELRDIQLVVPFVRGVNEFLEVRRRLSVEKFGRNSVKIWMELAVPENIINLDEYLVAGLDGVVINLDELGGHLGGFDKDFEEVKFYKHQVEGLLKFLEDSFKVLHKSKIPVLAFGSLVLHPKVLEFLVEKGVSGVVVERYETSAADELLHQAEKRMVLGRTQ